MKAGEKIGFANGQPARRGKGDAKKGAAISAEVRSQFTREYYAVIVDVLRQAVKEYPDASYQALADALNKQGRVTTRNKPFTETAVYRIMQRYGVR